jgi:hypothetical protein
MLVTNAMFERYSIEEARIACGSSEELIPRCRAKRLRHWRWIDRQPAACLNARYAPACSARQAE